MPASHRSHCSGYVLNSIISMAILLVDEIKIYLYIVLMKILLETMAEGHFFEP